MHTQASIAPSAPPGRPASVPMKDRDGGTDVAVPPSAGSDAPTTDKPPATAPMATPLFTRHMRGVIEAERDRRRHDGAHRAAVAARAARRQSAVRPHPRLSAALDARRDELARERRERDGSAATAEISVPVPATA